MDDDFDPEAVARQLQGQVEERRARGELPADLEESLSRHYRRIVEHRQLFGVPAPVRIDPAVSRLQELLAQFDKAIQFDPSGVNIESNVPGGKVFHRAVTKVVKRPVGGVFDQVAHALAIVLEMLEMLTRAVDGLDDHLRRQVDTRLSLALDRLSDFDKEVSNGDLHLLRRRLEALEAAEARRLPFDATALPLELAEKLRGSEPWSAETAQIVETIKGSAPVLDLRAGSGELVRLLIENGVDAAGAEGDRSLASLAQSSQLPIDHVSPLDALFSRADTSLGAVVGRGTLDRATHAEVHYLARVLPMKMRGGAVGLFAGFLPEALVTWAPALADPAFDRPKSPEVVAEMFSASGGFSEVSIRLETGWYLLTAIR